MRKSILIVAGALILLTGSFFYGFVANERALPPSGLARAAYDEIRAVRRTLFAKPAEAPAIAGRWRRAPDRGAPPNYSEEFEQLAALGYVSGTQSAEGQSRGIVRYDPQKAAPGLNLFVSGHAPEAFLMTMQGEILHTWKRDFWSAFPGTDVPKSRIPAQFFRRARLLENGELLGIYAGSGLVKLDAASNVLWTFPGLAHHDLDLDAAGRIWVLTREIRQLERLNADAPVLEDFITVLDRDGNELRKISVLESFERSVYATFLDAMPPSGDLLHTNSVEILDATLADRSPAFQPGNLLISLRTLNVIAVLDPEREVIVWAMSGLWKQQHDPHLLANGDILVFDNQGDAGRSKVIELDPLTQRIVWTFKGTAELPFYTRYCGTTQRLANGNTLITESEPGRAFEITPAGETAWEFASPFRAGENGELVATLFDVVRLDPDTNLDWLTKN